MANENYTTSKTGRFVELITLHQSQIYAYIISLVPNFSNADDLLQKTCKTLWEKFEEYQPGTDFLAWAIVVANFKIREFWRTQKRNSGIKFNDKLLAEIEQDAQARSEDSNKYISYLNDCIQKLNETDFKIIKMKYFQNLKAQEIAVRFGISVFTIYKYLSRIHDVLYGCVTRSMLLEEKHDI
ncbi:MAG TPA: sigma-70 family RNA polymerase sigma factor [Anaerohalosphaeraceae bacterium]|nr:sigma-70 family RNA polymerase sigma factor [Anaerohalosphaeraceae bacterium]